MKVSSSPSIRRFQPLWVFFGPGISACSSVRYIEGSAFGHETRPVVLVLLFCAVNLLALWRSAAISLPSEFLGQPDLPTKHGLPAHPCLPPFLMYQAGHSYLIDLMLWGYWSTGISLQHQIKQYYWDFHIMISVMQH